MLLEHYRTRTQHYFASPFPARCRLWRVRRSSLYNYYYLLANARAFAACVCVYDFSYKSAAQRSSRGASARFVRETKCACSHFTRSYRPLSRETSTPRHSKNDTDPKIVVNVQKTQNHCPVTNNDVVRRRSILPFHGA